MKLPQSFVTVTPFSKILALALFVALPFIGFVLGSKYQENISNSKDFSEDAIPTPYYGDRSLVLCSDNVTIENNMPETDIYYHENSNIAIEFPYNPSWPVKSYEIVKPNMVYFGLPFFGHENCQESLDRNYLTFEPGITENDLIKKIKNEYGESIDYEKQTTKIGTAYIVEARDAIYQWRAFVSNSETLLDIFWANSDKNELINFLVNNIGYTTEIASYNLIYFKVDYPYSYEIYNSTRYEKGDKFIEIVYLPYGAENVIGQSKKFKENSMGKYYFDTTNIATENPEFKIGSRHSLYISTNSCNFELLTNDNQLSYNQIEKMLTDHARTYSNCFNK